MTEEETIYGATLNTLGTPTAAEDPAIQADLDAEHQAAERALADQITTALQALGPMVENVALIDTPTGSRLAFDMLHLSTDGAAVRHWDLPQADALHFLTGAVDGALYVMRLRGIAADREDRPRTRRNRKRR